MKKTLCTIFSALAILLGAISPASAITNGQPDEDNHPYVGLLVFDNASGPATQCSGSLIAPTVILTAGHCTQGAVTARIWFDSNVTGNPDYPFGGSSSIEGTPYTHPDFCIACGNGLPGTLTHDIGVVVLDYPVTERGFAVLPTSGFADTLAPKTPVEIVGYGVQFKAKVSGPPRDRWSGTVQRLYAPSQLIKNVPSAEYLKLTANPGQGKGGICFGDSGGPNLQAGTDIMLAVNSFVTNSNCTGVTYSSRIDIPSVLNWLSEYLD
jgi:hypothetical protein